MKSIKPPNKAQEAKDNKEHIKQLRKANSEIKMMIRGVK